MAVQYRARPAWSRDIGKFTGMAIMDAGREPEWKIIQQHL